MRTRIFSGFIVFVVMFAFIVCGGLPFKLIITAISTIGLYEFYKAMSGKILPVHFFGFTAGIIFDMFCVYIVSHANIFNAFSAGFIMLLLFYMVVFHKSCNDKDVFITLFGFYYVI